MKVKPINLTCICKGTTDRIEIDGDFIYHSYHFFDGIYNYDGITDFLWE